MKAKQVYQSCTKAVVKNCDVTNSTKNKSSCVKTAAIITGGK